MMQHFLLRLVSLLVFFFVWHVVASTQIFNAALFPSPLTVLHTLQTELIGGYLANDTLVSFTRAVIGLTIGVILGITTGMITGISRIGNLLLGSVLHLVRPIPPISYVFLIVLWIGIGETSKYVLVTIGVFFPVWINTHQGVLNISKIYLWTANTLHFSLSKMIRRVYLPGSLPYILSGIRVAVAISFYTLVAAELAGAYSGLAYRIDIAHLVFRVDLMLAGMIMLGVLSITLDSLIQVLAAIMFPWINKKTYE